MVFWCKNAWHSRQGFQSSALRGYIPFRNCTCLPGNATAPAFTRNVAVELRRHVHADKELQLSSIGLSLSHECSFEFEPHVMSKTLRQVQDLKAKQRTKTQTCCLSGESAWAMAWGAEPGLQETWAEGFEDTRNDHVTKQHAAKKSLRQLICCLGISILAVCENICYSMHLAVEWVSEVRHAVATGNMSSFTLSMDVPSPSWHYKSLAFILKIA